MKLLDKKTIALGKSTERKREVDEGMKLAKSIDALRETHAKEQIGLKNFRDENLGSIKAEIQKLTDSKEVITQEIIALEERRKTALAPIDLTNEWRQVELTKKELTQRETNLISREILFQDVDKREKQVSLKEKEAEKYFEGARLSYSKTEDIRSDMEQRSKVANEAITERLKVIDIKEKELISRESIVTTQKEEFTKERNELLVRGTSLIERESKVETETKSLIEREEKVKEDKALTQRYLDEATRNYDISETIKFDLQNTKEKSEKDIEHKYQLLSEREKTIGYRERDLILEKESLENEKKEIEKEKIHIASQQQTLKAAWDNIKRLQK